MQQPLTAPFRIGGIEIPNRVLLAPLAGIGNWFVRLQARRHGAGMAVSEMVSSFALHHGNERTRGRCSASIPTSTRSRCSSSAPSRRRCAPPPRSSPSAGADLIDINMGCPVREGRQDRRRRGPARPARPRGGGGAGGARGLGPAGDGQAPLRPSRPATTPATTSRCGWRTRPAWPRSASTRARPQLTTRAGPTTSSRGELVAELGDAATTARRDLRRARRRRARPGRLRVLRRRRGHGRARGTRLPVDLRGAHRRADGAAPTDHEVVEELRWVLARAEEHWGRGARRAKPAEVLSLVSGAAGRPRPGRRRYQRTVSLDDVRALLAGPRNTPLPGGSNPLSRRMSLIRFSRSAACVPAPRGRYTLRAVCPEPPPFPGGVRAVDERGRGRPLGA